MKLKLVAVKSRHLGPSGTYWAIGIENQNGEIFAGLQMPMAQYDSISPEDSDPTGENVARMLVDIVDTYNKAKKKKKK